MDVEKTMEFILAVQARIEAAAEKQSEQIAAHEERLARLESSIATVTDLVGRLAQAEIRLVDRIDAAATATATGFRDLRELHADTESKLNALIATVDKLVRRNGHPE